MKASTISSLPMVVIALLDSPCSAQSASVAVTHNHSTGVIQPGEVVRLTYALTWTGAVSVAHIAGDGLATPDAGTAGQPSNVNPLPSPLINPGTAVLGSIRGVELQSPPPFVLGPPSPFFVSPLHLVSYDWTAPATPGTISFNWVPRPDLLNAQFYLTIVSSNPTPLPTTYLGTSLTVIPAPHAALVLLAGVCTITAARRRR